MPFLARTIDKNAALIHSAGPLHQEAKIPANTLLVDLDAVTHNAKLLKEEAARVGLSLCFRTKQYGRNPLVSRAVVGDSDIKAVAVDMQCARALHYNGIPLGNIGNLCQVPEAELPVVVGQMCPAVVTVFSVDKARSISVAAVKADRVQELLIRVGRDGDVVFPGMDGG